ncbi:MAG: chitobiase/beta-hexosaminidase C-terminal domain-containing protein, partial [Thermoplasmata archaeon]
RQYNRRLLGTYDTQPEPEIPGPGPEPCKVDTPVIMPNEVCQSMWVNVTITCTTAGATIYYTTDGSEPSTTSTLYTGMFLLFINDTVTVKAKAYSGNCTPSDTASQTYNRKFKVLTPTITPNGGYFNTTVTVSISCGTPNATIYYKAYKMGTPEPSNWSVYTGSFNINDNTTVKAMAKKGGCWEESDIAKADFYFQNKVATPIIKPSGRNFTSYLNITISCATPWAVIYYTLDGTEPTQSSIKYTGSFGIWNTTTVKAKAFLTNWLPSDTATEYYNKIGN